MPRDRAENARAFDEYADLAVGTAREPVLSVQEAAHDGAGCLFGRLIARGDCFQEIDRLVRGFRVRRLIPFLAAPAALGGCGQ